MYGLYHATATKLSIASCGLLTIVLKPKSKHRKTAVFFNATSSNGRTLVSGTSYLGSNPGEAAIIGGRQMVKSLAFEARI
jgi:hypothetical protein